MGIKETLQRNASYKDSDVYRIGAFNPGLFDLNKSKLKALRPQLFGLRLGVKNIDTWQNIYTQLNDGDIEPAVVVSTDPLLVACYSDDMDAVALFCFPQEVGLARGWHLGTRLIATAAYNSLLMKGNKDLDCGPRNCGRFKAYGPVIADLYTDNTERLERKKREIPQELWDYTTALGLRYVESHPGMARDGLGFPYADAVPITDIKVNPKAQLD